MPTLDWITVSGFKSIANIEKIRLTPINLIIGANGSGKSNFISAFSFLNTIREGNLQTYVKSAGGADRLLHFGSKQTPSMQFHISFAGEVNQYRIDLIPTDDDSLIPFDEQCYFWNKIHPQPYVTGLNGANLEAAISTPQKQAVVQYVKQHLDRWRLYHFHDVGLHQ